MNKLEHTESEDNTTEGKNVTGNLVGITPRDLFAAAALAGLCADPHSNRLQADTALQAWELADFMMAMRENE